MERSGILPAITLGCALSLAACVDTDTAETDDENVGETADEAPDIATGDDGAGTTTYSYQREDGTWAEGQRPTTVDNGPAAASWREHDRDGYVVDGTNFVRASMGPSGMDALNIYLQDLHRQTGHDVHLYFTNSNLDPDAEGAMGHADAIIFIRPAQRGVTVIGEGITEAEGEAISSAMVAAFDANDFTDGYVNAFAATGEAMGS